VINHLAEEAFFHILAQPQLTNRQNAMAQTDLARMKVT
jgi:hypothetical protein